MCLFFVSSPLFDGCPSQLCLSRWSGSSRRARFRRPVSGVLACVSAIKTWETVSSSNPPVCIAVQKLSCTQQLSELTYGVCAGCFALCCLPLFTCKVTNAVGACPCLPLLDCIGCVPPASLAMRASVRQRYGIQVTTA